MQSESDIVNVVRPDEHRLSPGYRVGISESAVQIFRMKTEALHFDTGRASFVVKSPGLGVLMQSRVILDFSVDITAPFLMSYDQAVQAVVGCRDKKDPGDGTKEDLDCSMGVTPKLCFSGGDAFGKAISSMTVTVNGAAVSNHNQNLYMRSLADCWISPEAYQSRFSQCGGPPSSFSSVPVSGTALAYDADYAAGSPIVAGFTGDSGVNTRIQNLWGCVESFGDGAADGDKIRVRCQVPLWGCGLFNGFAPDDKISQSCPLSRSMNALAHFNNWTVELLFSDLIENIFRDLGAQEEAGGGDIEHGNQPNGYTITLATDVKPALETIWLRLPSYRLIPERIVASTFRITTHRESSKKVEGGVVIPAAITRVGVGALTDSLPSVGLDRNAQGRCAERSESKKYTSYFTAVQSAQPCQYLFFCFQKSSKVYTLAGGEVAKVARLDTFEAGDPHGTDDAEAAGCKNYLFARNADANAGILDFSLTVLSSVGSYTYSSDKFPNLKKRRELWTDHKSNCVADYCQNSMNIWVKNKCCLLLHISDYIRGLSTENTAFPIQLDAEVTWVNYRSFADGYCAASIDRPGLAFMKDQIQGTPIMAQIFTGGAMQITSTSAVTSTANLSQSSATDILARRGG